MPLADRRLLVALSLTLVLAAVASVAWPLATYTLTLASFGLAHVLAELRYVDLRFGRALGRTLAAGMGVTLLGVAGLRLGTMAGIFSSADAVVLELSAGFILVALVLPSLFRRSIGAGLVGVTAAAALGLAIVISPVAAMLTIAVVHNFTPAGFIYNATTGRPRRIAMTAVFVVFVVVPALIATGYGWSLATASNLAAPEASPLGYGPLQDAMRAYLPPSLDPMLALHLFSACVFLQCAHYTAVIGVMPRWLGPKHVGWFPWPKRWGLIVLGAALLASAPFAIDFAAARRGYGVLAAIHAWVELPILLLALLGSPARVRKIATTRSRRMQRSSRS